MSNYEPKLSSAELLNNFSDIAPNFSALEAVVESSRCLYCYDAPCMRACPTHINVPQFIQEIADQNLSGAAKTIFTQNILGASCGRVCPTEVLCEGACVLNAMNKKPIEIGRLQRHASQFAIEKDIHFWKAGSPSGKKIAIVGAGPAGLSCAYELTKLGHSCMVYEAQERAGGLNTYGIAAYKLDTKAALAEVEYIKKIGIEIALNTAVGEKPSFQELLKTYDAVFLGVGLGSTSKLNIPGEELQGVMESLDFIRPTREINFKGSKIGERVLVIGAGNTAIDVATAAVRLGAKSVQIVYRRTDKEMPAFKYEYELAKKDGVGFCWLTVPEKVVGENGRVTGLQCSKMKLTPVSNGKGKLEKVAGSEHVIPCDMVVKALGQDPLTEMLKKISGLEFTDGNIKVEASSGATSVKKLFAGGDALNGGSEVVDAVEQGKIAARGINQFLGGR